LPTKDLNPDKSFDNLASPGGSVDHVDVCYNAGHPGVGAGGGDFAISSAAMAQSELATVRTGTRMSLFICGHLLVQTRISEIAAANRLLHDPSRTAIQGS